MRRPPAEGSAITTTIIAPALAILVGAGVQRVSGIGSALIVSPLLVLLLGPYEGVALANVLAFVVSVMTLATMWRDVDLRRVWTLVPAGLVGVIPGVIVARWVPTDVLQIIVGGLILVGMLLVSWTSRVAVNGAAGTNLAAGLTSGFMTATAGVGGPALTVYAVATGWEQRAFAATAQISFAGQAGLSAALKGLPDLSLRRAVLFVVLVGVGLGCGHILAGRVSQTVARRIVVGVAVLGATAAVVKGVVGLVVS